MSDVVDRLKCELLAFAAGYPDDWASESDLGVPPLGRVVNAFAKRIAGAPEMCVTARRLGAELRGKYRFATPDEKDEASADQTRGLTFLGAVMLHGDDCADFCSDKLSAEQIAFFVAEDCWVGRDDRPIEDWPEILPVRTQLMLDALNLPKGERADVLGFATRFMRRHPELVRDAWGLRAVGHDMGVPDEVCDATRGDTTLRGVYFFAELILAQMPDEGAVN